MVGLYVHLPFCRVHCTYCPFAISTDISLEQKYVDAVVREIESATVATADSLYFGGGTPSRTSVSALRRIFDAVRRRFELTAGAEISLESNPEDVTESSVAEWLALGVTRISIGVQSFHDRELTPLNRLHSASRALEAVSVAASTGVRTNLDLILGLPGQSAQSFRESIEAAIGSGAGHVSLYLLDLEEKTPLLTQVTRGRVELPEDSLVADLYQEAVETLTRGGLVQYEVSNFARRGEECRHNLRYWRRGEYHGFGMAAHSFMGGRRYANTRDIRRYIETSPSATDFSETIGDDESRRETLFLGLRQVEGLHYDLLIELCGKEGVEWVDRGLGEGWLRRSDGRVGFTSAGFLLSNEYISQLF